jgi:hypothetical protein
VHVLVNWVPMGLKHGSGHKTAGAAQLQAQQRQAVWGSDEKLRREDEGVCTSL